MNKVGFIFGTFSPIHVGHLIMSTVCLNNGFDKIYYVPSFNPFKNTSDTQFQHSIEMVKLALKNSPNADKLGVLDIEYEMYLENKKNGLNRPNNYTYDVLNKIKEVYPEMANSDMTLIIGADCFFEIHRWNNYKNLIKDFNITVLNRMTGKSGYGDISESKIFHFLFDQLSINPYNIKDVNCSVSMPLINISSNEIRTLIKNDKDISFFVTDAVNKYIIENKLFK